MFCKNCGTMLTRNKAGIRVCKKCTNPNFAKDHNIEDRIKEEKEEELSEEEYKLAKYVIGKVKSFETFYLNKKDVKNLESTLENVPERIKNDAEICKKFIDSLYISFYCGRKGLTYAFVYKNRPEIKKMITSPVINVDCNFKYETDGKKCHGIIEYEGFDNCLFHKSVIQ